MKEIKVKELIDAGVHFGHLTRKWNPNMSPFIYSEKNGIHIINLYLHSYIFAFLVQISGLHGQK